MSVPLQIAVYEDVLNLPKSETKTSVFCNTCGVERSNKDKHCVIYRYSRPSYHCKHCFQIIQDNEESFLYDQMIDMQLLESCQM